MSFKHMADDILIYDDGYTQGKPLMFKITENGCYECISHAHKKAYARITRFYKKVLVHRWIYMREVGDIPDGMIIRHKCDNPKCANPSHLEIGTGIENARDMVERNKTMKVTRILTKQEEEYISTSKKTPKELAEELRVSKQDIYQARKRWKYAHSKPV